MMAGDQRQRPNNMSQVLHAASEQLKQLDRIEDMAIVAAWLAGGIAAQAGADLDGLLAEVRDVYQQAVAEMRDGNLTPAQIQWDIEQIKKQT